MAFTKSATRTTKLYMTAHTRATRSTLYPANASRAKMFSDVQPMTPTNTTTDASHPAVRAPRGTQLSCKGWQQEAALRMLMNNLDPEVAERPDDLIVYGGTGRAARSWEAYHSIVRSLRSLAGDETLLVQSGKPVGVFRTHAYAPRVLIANSNLVGQWNDWNNFAELDRAGR